MIDEFRAGDINEKVDRLAKEIQALRSQVNEILGLLKAMQPVASSGLAGPRTVTPARPAKSRRGTRD